MSRTNPTTVTPLDVVHILRDHPRRWIVPIVALGSLACVVALLTPPTWVASQAMIVRDEASGGPTRPGKFQQLDEMKTVQETILELARSRAVLRAALGEVEPDEKHNPNKRWPTDAAVTALSSRVTITPPKGAEFGKTEVFYLNIEASTRLRASDLAAAVSKHLQLRMQELRNRKAQSLVAELTETVDLAKNDLETATRDLTAVESRVGSDLSDLRVLNESNGGDSPLRRSINEMEHEVREARQSIEANTELLTMLEASKADPTSLVAAPNRLLEMQPSLRRLKEGLVDAQIQAAQLSGNMTDEHPAVIAAKISQTEIVEHVRRELDSSIRGVRIELELSQQRAESLRSQIERTNRRLADLAQMRAVYSNAVAEQNHRAEILKTAQQQLAEARASQMGSRTASLITAIDGPIAGDSPAGPRKAVIVAAGLFVGLILGLGIVMLTVSPTSTQPVLERRAIDDFGADEPVADIEDDHPVTLNVSNTYTRGHTDFVSMRDALQNLVNRR